MRIEAAIRGDLDKVMRREADIVERAVTIGVDNAGELLKRSIRTDIVRAGLGTRLAKTVRNRRYPRSGFSAEAASLVSFNAPKIVHAFDDGVTVRARNGKYLAVPTDAARGFRRILRQVGNPSAGSRERRTIGGRRQQLRSPTPQMFLQAGIPLRTIPKGPGRPYPLIVTQSIRATRTGRFVKNPEFTRGGRKRQRDFVVLFVLVPQVKLRKRLNIDRLSARAERLIPQLILREFRRYDD